MKDNRSFSQIKAGQEEEKSKKELSLRRRLEFLNEEVAHLQNIILDVLLQYANELLTDGVVDFFPPTIKDSALKSPYWVVCNKGEPQKLIWVGLFFENEKSEWPATGFWVKAKSSGSSTEYTRLSKQSLIEAITKLYDLHYFDK